MDIDSLFDRVFNFERVYCISALDALLVSKSLNNIICVQE